MDRRPPVREATGDQPGAAGDQGTPERPGRTWPLRVWAAVRRARWLRRGAVLVIGLLVLENGLVPQLAGARQTWHLLDSVQPGYLLAGVLAEAAALLSWSLLTRTVLPAPG